MSMPPERDDIQIAGFPGAAFKAVRLRQALPPGFEKLSEPFRRWARVCHDHGMTPQSTGNLSLRLAEGMAITASGAQLADLAEDQVVWVRSCSVEDRTVEYVGSKAPSFEVFLHFLTYQDRPDAQAVVHVHNLPPTGLLAGKVALTPRWEDYGSVALARLAVQTLAPDEEVIALQDHGYVAVGASLEEAVRRALARHEEVLEEIGQGLDPSQPL